MEKVCLFKHMKNILDHNQFIIKLSAYQLPQNLVKTIDFMTNFEYAVHQKTDIILNN